MHGLSTLVHRSKLVLRHQHGATAAEYAIVLAVIAGGLLVTVPPIGAATTALFERAVGLLP